MLFFVLVMENEKKHGRYDIKFTMGNFNLSGQKKQVVSEKLIVNQKKTSQVHEMPGYFIRRFLPLIECSPDTNKSFFYGTAQVIRCHPAANLHRQNHNVC